MPVKKSECVIDDTDSLSSRCSSESGRSGGRRRACKKGGPKAPVKAQQATSVGGRRLSDVRLSDVLAKFQQCGPDCQSAGGASDGVNASADVALPAFDDDQEDVFHAPDDPIGGRAPAVEAPIQWPDEAARRSAEERQRRKPAAKHIHPCVCDLSKRQRANIEQFLREKRAAQQRFERRVQEIEEEIRLAEEAEQQRLRELEEAKEFYGDEYEMEGAHRKRKKRSARRASMVSLGVKQIINWRKPPKVEVRYTRTANLRAINSTYCKPPLPELPEIRPVDVNFEEPEIPIRATRTVELRLKFARSQIETTKARQVKVKYPHRPPFVTQYWYLASGLKFTDLHYIFRLGVSTISKIVKSVCRNIWIHLRRECIPLPTQESWELIARKFDHRTNFCHCLGAVDGKHIHMENPLGSMYFNYKGYSSIVLMAIADSEYRFIFVDIGGYGKDHDATIFQRTSIWRGIEDNKIELPSEECLPGRDKLIPYFFIGDEAFPLHKHLLRPYGGSNLSVKKRVFNYRLSRARRYVECTFGILSNKWRIFHRPINLKPEFVVSITQACVVLHNFVRDRNGYKFEDTLTITGLEDCSPDNGILRGGVQSIRDHVADYFMEEGAVSWQMSKI